MKPATYVFRFPEADFDIHLVPHSTEAAEAMNQKARAKGKSISDYLMNEAAMVLVLGDLEEEETATSAATDH